MKTYNTTFLDTKTDKKFDFITAIYVFPAILVEEMNETVKKIKGMLEENGRFILVVANEKYLEKKLSSLKDLFLESDTISFDGKNYKEILHYADIPKIGKVMDYNREEQFYLDLFTKHDFALEQKKNIDDNGFLCTVFVFQKKKK